MSSRTKVLDDILYAQCWEDPRIDRQALRIGPGDTVFSITSGGCNVLAFLLDDPHRVIALDFNRHQNHLLDLKMAAFRGLDHESLLAFVGVTPCEQRLALYHLLRPFLGDESRRWWDRRPDHIRRGILHAGRYEHYLRTLRTWLYRVKGRRLVEKMLRTESAEVRARIYRRRWDGPHWRVFTNLLLSRAVMTLLFDKAFFAQLEDEMAFGPVFRRRVEHALTTLPVRTNPFLQYILRGNFESEGCLPLYLRPESFEPIRQRLDRVELVTGTCQAHFAMLPADTISKFNFTNIFEWMPPGAFQDLLEETVRVAADGAVMTYRNLLVPRRRPEAMRDRIEGDRALAARLHAEDLSFIYGSYVVETIRKDAASWAA